MMEGREITNILKVGAVENVMNFSILKNNIQAAVTQLSGFVYYVTLI